jgi:hypothetical protein
MSDRPDFTSNTALNAVADTLDNLPVSINAQTLGSLAVDIAAQSAGEVDINLSTNSAGDIDINFQSQSGAVESGTEFAASQANTVSGTVVVAASPGNNDLDTLFNNTTGNPVVVEFVSGSQINGFADPVRLQFQLQDGSANTIAEVEANPVNLPLSLDPGVRIPSNGDVEARLENNAGSSVAYSLELIGREVV